MNYQLPKLPFAYDALKGISKQVNEWHHDKHFASYITGRNEVQEKLAKMRSEKNWQGVRAVMLAESHNASGSILHNNYYNILGGNGEVSEELEIIKAINKYFGDFEKWKAEFVEVAKQARGWAILAYDITDGELHNALVDFHDEHIAFGYIPLVSCDVWEHAYYFDYGPDRASYIDAFFNNLDWKKVDEVYTKFMSVRY
jgi:Fe-Mn family superoxide dismutase